MVEPTITLDPISSRTVDIAFKSNLHYMTVPAAVYEQNTNLDVE